MSLMDAVAVLREMTLFRGVDPRRLKVIAMMGDTQIYRDGERVFEQGAVGDAAYIILSGAVEVRVGTPDDEATVAELGSGEIFGELAVICETPRSSAIVARGALSVLRLDQATVMTLLREFPDVTLQLVRILGARLEATTHRLAESRSD